MRHLETLVNFHWKQGIEFTEMIRKMEEFFSGKSFRIADDYFGLGYQLQYAEPDGMLHCRIMSPLRCYTLDVQRCQRLTWSIRRTINGKETDWFDFDISHFQGVDDPWNSFRDGKVVRLRSMADRELCTSMLDSSRLSQEIVEQYQDLKHLFKTLEADEVNAYNECWSSCQWTEDDPVHDGKLFRFSRSGTQILLRPCEDETLLNAGGFTIHEEHPWRMIFPPNRF